MVRSNFLTSSIAPDLKNVLVRLRHRLPFENLIRSIYVQLVINETVEWKKLEQHASATKSLHLKNLLQDPDRCAALVSEFDGR